MSHALIHLVNNVLTHYSKEYIAKQAGKNYPDFMLAQAALLREQTNEEQYIAAKTLYERVIALKIQPYQDIANFELGLYHLKQWGKPLSNEMNYGQAEECFSNIQKRSALYKDARVKIESVNHSRHNHSKAIADAAYHKTLASPPGVKLQERGKSELQPLKWPII